MKYLSELIYYVLIGALLGGLIWFIGYNINKTPAIVGFDGPALYYLACSAIAGCAVFTIIGVVAIKRANKK